MTDSPPEPASVNVPVDGPGLRAARKQRGVTITQLAGRAGVSRSYVSKIERGDRERVRPYLLAAMAEALGVEPTRLARP